MHLLLSAVVSLVLGYTLASPLQVHPGGAADVIVNGDDTLNATITNFRLDSPTSYMQLSIVNNIDSDTANFYVTGLDSEGAVVLLQPNGSWYYPTTNSSTPVKIIADVAIPLGPKGNTTYITLPGYVSSARIWFADGNLTFYTVLGYYGASLVEPSAVNPNDPSADVNWGFVELSYGSNIIYVNISYVDFVGLPIGISLYGDMGVQTAPGLKADAVENICAALKIQAGIDGQPWDDLCMTDAQGNPIRVLSPTDYISIEPNAFSDYWTDYINEVWNYYATMPLTFITDGEYGDVNCTVSNEILNCTYDNRGYAKPTAYDIFGCNQGPFALTSTDNVVHQRVVPILCAAFHRSTLLLEGGNVQPSLNESYYYTSSPTNWFSKFVHANEVSGIGYAFAYDDVTPGNSTNESGTLVDTAPYLLAITAGGPISTSTTSFSSSIQAASSTSSATGTSSSSSMMSTASTSIIAVISSISSTTVSSSSTLPSPSKSSTSPLASSTGAGPTPTNGVGFLGCATDPMDGGGRALTDAAMNSTDMTVETCVTFCLARSLPLAGLEDGSQCYCGDDLIAESDSEMLYGNSTCNTACDGNSSEFCGGAKRLSVFYRKFDGSAALHDDLRRLRKRFMFR